MADRNDAHRDARDAPEQQYTIDERVARLEADMRQQKAATNALNTQMAVSYTHLTLPTILRV